MEQLWGFLGKIAVLLGIILTVLKIREHFKNSGSKLAAKVEPLKVIIPPQVLSFPSDFLNKWSDLKISYKMGDIKEAGYEEISNYLQSLYKTLSYGGVIRDALSHCGGYWKIEIKNTSATLFKHVHLDIPNCNYATVQQHNKVQCTDVDQIIRIEEIRPDEIVLVNAWVTGEPSFYDAKRIKLSHDSGKGSIKPVHTIDSDSPINSISYQIRRDIPLAFVAAVVLVAFLSVFNKHPDTDAKNKTATTNAISGVASSTNTIPLNIK